MVSEANKDACCG